MKIDRRTLGEFFVLESVKRILPIVLVNFIIFHSYSLNKLNKKYNPVVYLRFKMSTKFDIKCFAKCYFQQEHT